MPINVFVIIRIFLGVLFIVSGFEKLIGPYQNFLYVVQNYEIFYAPIEEFVARVFPWIEFLLGVFLALGLWMKWILRGIILMIAMFIIIVSQALLRGLPIQECGCFGELISFSLPVIVGFDSMLLILTGLLMKQGEETKILSLDDYFDE